MEKDLKDLLLKDICGRLPYRVKVSAYRFGDSKRTEVVETLYAIYKYDWSMETEEDDFVKPIGKPYLFPLSSMTEEQKEFLRRQSWYIAISTSGTIETTIEGFDWLNKNHFDYRGLIEKSLAIDATNLEIYK